MTQSNTRTVFNFISDGTGNYRRDPRIQPPRAVSPTAASARSTAAVRGQSGQAIDCATQIREAAESDGVRPIVFNTLVNPDSVDVDPKSNALFRTIRKFKKSELGPALHPRCRTLSPRLRVQAHRAINFTAHDAASPAGLAGPMSSWWGLALGQDPHQPYLAMQFGVKAANCLLIPEDFERNKLPGELHLSLLLFGLMIHAGAPGSIRQERRPNFTPCISRKTAATKSRPPSV